MVVTIAYSQVFALAMAVVDDLPGGRGDAGRPGLGHHGGRRHERGDPGPGRDQQPDGPGARRAPGGPGVLPREGALAFWRLEDARAMSSESAALYFGVGLRRGRRAAGPPALHRAGLRHRHQHQPAGTVRRQPAGPAAAGAGGPRHVHAQPPHRVAGRGRRPRPSAPTACWPASAPTSTTSARPPSPTTSSRTGRRARTATPA